jgi:outer membrane receptor protein involved in Fe transport
MYFGFYAITKSLDWESISSYFHPSVIRPLRCALIALAATLDIPVAGLTLDKEAGTPMSQKLLITVLLLFFLIVALPAFAEAGFFYKQLSSPIVSITTFTTTGPYAGYKVTQPVNAGSAWVTGLEFAYQQRLSYLPGLLGGLGISANYSWTVSTAHDVSPLRSDSPALLRQAPNTWNLSPTYDKGGLSIRMGLSYNGANIYQYQYQNLQYACDTCTSTVPLVPQPVAGTKGPAGDNYLYPHLQVDAQGSYRLPRGFSVYA